ncbi:hypothetical protein, partial [Ancrocorticia populi]|uniref:hypothetical protein n=1 Tax=Ancrocorticia populi TaxID=2175228 RepID=UPI003F8FBD7D
MPSAISRQDFHLLGSPNNNLRWLHNRAVARRTSESLRLAMPTFYCLFKWNDDLTVTRIGSDSDQLDASEAGLLALIRREGIVRLLPASWSHGVGSWLSFDGQTYAIDGEIKSPDGLLEHLHQASAGQSMILASGEDAMRTTGEALGYADAVIRLYIAKDSSGLAKVVDSFLEVDSGSHSTPLTAGDRFAQEIRIDQSSGALQDSAVIPNFSQLKAEIESVFSEDCLGFRFISVDVSLTGEGYLIEDIARSPEYPRASQFSDEANALLLGLLQERIQKLSEQPHIGARAAEKAGEKAERYRRRIEAFQLRSIGFTGRMARNWVNRVEDDKRQDDQFSEAYRKAAHRLGYMPATAARLGISEHNAGDFISERDYSYVHPLNGKYAKWVRDRASALEIFKPFVGLFEGTHYQFLWRDGDVQILPLSPRAQEYSGSVTGLAQFLSKEFGEGCEVALVPSAYTGGVRLVVSYSGGHFVVNGVPYTHDEFHMLLRRRVRRRSFVLIDPAEADQKLSTQFPDAAGSIKVIMMNPDGATPQVAEAFVDIRQAVNTGELVKASVEVEQGADIHEAESEIEAQLALQQDVDEADEVSGPTADDWSEIEPEEQIEVDEFENRKVHFLSRIDPFSGEYNGARAIVDKKLYTFESDPVGGQAFEGLIGQWSTIVEQLTEMCRFAPQLEFVEFTLVPDADAFKITHISAMPSYGYVYPFSPKTVDFLKGRVAMKKADMRNASKRARRWLHNAKLRIRKSFGQAVYPKGLVPYQSVRWIGDMARDFREPNGISVRKKLWAYRNGLLSYRITQYGITKENREDFISDLEYRWLRHINKKYKYWLEDKISIKYVASQFNECFP